MSPARLARYFHTIRHLRTAQIAWRLWNMVRPHRVDARPPPVLRSWTGSWQQPLAGSPVMTGADTFNLLNFEARCASAADWQHAGSGRLWSYTLHYFDDLNARDADHRASWHRALMQRWIAENPPGQGIGWEAYPVSRRIINWVKWVARGHELSAVARHSLAVQLRWLANHIEFHILGNHLIANAKALVFGGAWFGGDEGEAWLNRGVQLMNSELAAQVLDDGGHFELSPMYHAAVLEDLLDLFNVTAACGSLSLDVHRALAARMQDWLEQLTHPDGDIAFFNDSAFDVAPTAAQLRGYAQRLGVHSRASMGALTNLTASGYLRARRGPADLLCDCALVGPDHLPGHAHADTLSFEFSFAGHRVFVNSGTSEYEASSERDRQRGTAAHNTVVVNGCNSSEIWGSFRVARRAYPRLLASFQDENGIHIHASHDGYRRLGAGDLRRRWQLGDESLTIEDEIEVAGPKAVARFHLHPKIEVSAAEPHCVMLVCGEQRLTLKFVGASRVSVLPSSWHPRFGVSQSNVCIEAGFSGNRLQTELHWRP